MQNFIIMDTSCGDGSVPRRREGNEVPRCSAATGAGAREKSYKRRPESITSQLFDFWIAHQKWPKSWLICFQPAIKRIFWWSSINQYQLAKIETIASSPGAAW